MESIKKELFEMCTDLLDDLSVDEIDCPLKILYIDYSCKAKNKKSIIYKKSQETYKYENGILEKVETGTKANQEFTFDMYYTEGSASISIDMKKRVASFDYCLGPLFARGYRFKILDTEEGKLLGVPELIWIS